MCLILYRGCYIYGLCKLCLWQHYLKSPKKLTMKKKSCTGVNSSLKKMPTLSKSLFTTFTFLATSLLFLQSCKKQEFSNNITSANQSSAIAGTYDLKLVADNFVSPVTVIQPDDGTKRLFVVDEIGKIWIIFPDGSKSATPFLDISSKMVSLLPDYDERGLLGLAFHPDFKA